MRKNNYCYYIYVKSLYRGRGVATKMLTEIESGLRWFHGPFVTKAWRMLEKTLGH
jgi:hypothetical protein